MRKLKTINISGEKFRNLRTAKALTQEEFARKIGLTSTRVSQIERVKSSGIFLKVFRKLSLLTGDPVEKLLFDLSADVGGETSKLPENWDNNVDPSKIIPVPDIPTFELAVAAGPWTEVSEIAELHDPVLIRDGRFRIWIRGNSMEKTYMDGVLVEFQSIRGGVDQVKVGKDYYVQVENMATFKKLEKASKGEFVFRAINRKKYPDPIIVSQAEVTRMAKAVYLIQELD